MKTFLLLFALLLEQAAIAQDTFQQKQFANYKPFAKRYDLQNFALSGDSLLVVYKALSEADRPLISVWVLPDGTTIPTLPKDNLAAVRRSGDEIFYYQDVSEKKERALKITSASLLDVVIKLEGEIIGSFVEGNVFMVLYDDVAKRIVELELNKNILVKTTEYQIPKPMLEKRKDSAPTFFYEDAAKNSLMGAAPFKLYRQSGRYFITFEKETVWNVQSGSEVNASTLFAALDDEEVIDIPVFGSDNVSSFYIEQKLFRLMLNKQGAHLDVFDVSTKERLSSSRWLGDTTKLQLFERNGTAKTVDANISFYTFLKSIAKSAPSINVTKSNGKFVVQCGNTGYEPDPNITTATVVGGLVGYLVTYAIVSSIKSKGDSPTNDQYFFVSFDPSDKKLATIPRSTIACTRANIDDYELKNFVFPKIKAYAEGPAGTVGIYLDRNAKALSIVKFTRE